MCLIFTHHPDTVLDAGWIGNFYWHNADGIGVMSVDHDQFGAPYVKIEKGLPQSADQAWDFYVKHIQGKECVVHFRMRTHGDVNIDQIHPYIIAGSDDFPTLAYMHNGVLDCGNRADPSKSDTWHFNEWYMKPLLNPDMNGHPDLAFNDTFNIVLAEYIGSGNRFVFMNDLGQVSIVNEDAGVHWRGMWLANTYAWDAPGHVFASRHVRGAKLAQDWDDMLDKAPTEDEMAYQHGWYSRSNDLRGWAQPSPKEKGTVVNGSVALVPSTNTTQTSVTVASDGTGTERAVVRNGVLGACTIAEWKMNQFDSMFDMLKQQGCSRAWAKLTYKALDGFEDWCDLDQLWDAIYLTVDGTITEDRLIEIVNNPLRWAHAPERKEQLSPTRIREEEEASNDEVIAATLPRFPMPEMEDDYDDQLGVESFSPAMPAIDNDTGRPVYDCRTEV